MDLYVCRRVCLAYVYASERDGGGVEWEREGEMESDKERERSVGERVRAKRGYHCQSQFLVACLQVTRERKGCG